MKNKNKSQTLPLNTIVIAILVIIVLLVIIVFFVQKVGEEPNLKGKPMTKEEIYDAWDSSKGSLVLTDSKGGVLQIYNSVISIEHLCSNSYRTGEKISDLNCTYQVRNGDKECFCKLPTETIYKNPNENCTIYKYVNGSFEVQGNYCPITIEEIKPLVVTIYSQEGFDFKIQLPKELSNLTQEELNSLNISFSMDSFIEGMISGCNIAKNQFYSHCEIRRAKQ